LAEAPRIYNLFPLLAGAVDSWSAHLPRIAGMGFTHILLTRSSIPAFRAASTR